MAATAGTIDVSMPKLISTLTLRVRFARLAGVRVWLAAAVVRLAGVIAGCDVQIDTPLDQDLEFTPDGIPRALSTSELDKGYRRDASVHGRDLIIRLDGVEQADAVSYDIDVGRVSRYARTEDGQLRLARLGQEATEGGLIVETCRGVVTVERRNG